MLFGFARGFVVEVFGVSALGIRFVVGVRRVEEVYGIDTLFVWQGRNVGLGRVCGIGFRVGEGFGLGGFTRQGVGLCDGSGCGGGLVEFFAAVFVLEVSEFLVHLHFEFVAGAAEFHHEAADLASYFRETPGAEEDESEDEDECVIAEVHEFL